MSFKENLFICYESDYEGKFNSVKTEKEWKNDYNKYGNKENFSDSNDWFDEMIRTGIFAEVK